MHQVLVRCKASKAEDAAHLLQGLRNATDAQKLAHPGKMYKIDYLLIISKLLIFYYL